MRSSLVRAMSTSSFGTVQIEGPAAGNPPRSGERREERAMTFE
jgi:hypothetical protein